MKMSFESELLYDEMWPVCWNCKAVVDSFIEKTVAALKMVEPEKERSKKES